MIRNLMSLRTGLLLLAVSFGLGLIAFGLGMSSPNITYIGGGVHNRLAQVDLPWSFEGARQNNNLVMEFELERFSPRTWRITPDDQLVSVKLNGKFVSLAHIPPEGLRDYSNGFELDLSNYLSQGKQRLEIRFHNFGGAGGIDVKPVWGFWFYTVLYIGALVLLLCLCGCFGLRASQQWILALALISIFSYWSDTPWQVRAHDVGGVGGHYQYIEYVATKKSLPKATDGWVYYHPPTYYLAGAAVWKLADWAGLPKHESLQLFSIFLWLVFLVSAIATVNMVTRHQPWARRVASLAIAFWPAGILHSPAIGNDAALYAVVGLATWMSCRWWRSGKRSHLMWLAMLCGLAVMIKTNGIVLLAVVGLLLLWRFELRSKRTRWRTFADGLYFGLIGIACIAASMAVRVYYYVKGETASWLIGNLGTLHSGLRVPADVKAFLPLDIPTYLTQPYINAFNSATGRENFWNYLLRSAITGEFSFQHSLLTILAYVMGLLLLMLFFWLMLGVPKVFHTSRVQLYRNLPLLLLGVTWLASLVTLRISVPYASSNDFRYVLPVLIPVIIFWVRQGSWPRWLLVLFSASSAAFYTATGFVG